MARPPGRGVFANAFAAAVGPSEIWRGHVPGPGASQLLLILTIHDDVVQLAGYLRPDVFGGTWSEEAMSHSQECAGFRDSAARYSELVLQGLGVCSTPMHGAPSFEIRERRLTITIAFGPGLLAPLPTTEESVQLHPPAALMLVKCLDALLPPPRLVLDATCSDSTVIEGSGALAGQKRGASSDLRAAHSQNGRHATSRGGKFRIGYG